MHKPQTAQSSPYGPKAFPAPPVTEPPLGAVGDGFPGDVAPVAGAALDEAFWVGVYTTS